MIRRVSVGGVAVLVLLCACEKKKSVGSVPTASKVSASPAESAPALEPSTSAASKSAPNKPARDPWLEKISKLSHQADQIAREAWWVATAEKLGPERSPFGKVKRAVLQVMDGKLAKKGVFQCDRYVASAVPGPQRTLEIAENCRLREPPKRIARWEFTGEKSAKVEFEPGNMGEVLGLGASIFSKRFQCELRWSDSDILEKLSCPKWEQDRGGGQVVSWEKFEYTRDGDSLLTLKGKILENLQAVRKIESKVPLSGKIVVTETQLQAPPEEKKPAPAKPVAPPKAARPGSAEPLPDHGLEYHEEGGPPPLPDHAPSADPSAPVYIPPVIPDPTLEQRRQVDPDLMRQQGTLPPPPQPPPPEEGVPGPDPDPELAPPGHPEYSPGSDAEGEHGQEIPSGR